MGKKDGDQPKTIKVKPFQLTVTEVKGENPGDSIHWGWSMAYRPQGEYACKAYCFGGIRTIHEYSKDVWVLNAVEKGKLRWEKLNTTGDAYPTYFATSGLVERYMIVFGGMSNIGWKSGAKLQTEAPTGHLQVLELDSKRWVPAKLLDSTRPPARALAASCVVGQKFYMFGGWGEKGLLRDLWCLDCTKHEWKWKRMPTSDLKPDARCKATLTALPDKNKLLLFGGGSVKDDVTFNDTWIYNLSTNKWEKQAQRGNVPTPRAGHSATLYKNLVVVFGGARRQADSNNEQWNCFDSLFIYELGSGQWLEPPQSTEVRTMPRKHHIAFTNDGILYLSGGKTTRQGNIDDENISLSPHRVYTVEMEVAFKSLLGPRDKEEEGKDLV